MTKKIKKILVFSPHPDDVDFAFAGTAAKLSKEGSEIIYCVITDGSKGAHKAGLNAAAMKNLRFKEQINAAGIVGVKKVLFLNEKDGEVENTKTLRKKLVKVIRVVRPDIIAAPDPDCHSFSSFYGGHRDHRETAEAVFDSIYPAAGSKYFFPELAKKFKPHNLEKPWFEAWFWNPESPNKFVDISKTIGLKLKALASHKSQFENIKEVESRVLERARENGKKAKVKYAEAFRRLTF